MLPRELKGGFLTMLYVLGSMSDPSGRLRFNDARGKPITRGQLAKGAGCDLKDASRYLHAAEAARVLTVDGVRRRGAAPLYILLMNPAPDWTAAATALAESKRKRPTKAAAPWRPPPDADQGGRSPSVTGSNQGGPAPSLDRPAPAATEGDRPPTDRGGPAPFDQGGPAPHRPGVLQEVVQEMADLGAQGADRAREEPNDLSQEWSDHEPTLYSFRAAARAQLRARGEALTPERVDACARQLHAASAAASAAPSPAGP